MDESNWRIVMLGKTGAGKSSVANTILGEPLFKTNTTANSETSKCQAETKTLNGRSITLIDTPGFFDTAVSEEELKTELIKCITECAPGPHAFLIVFKVEKFTEHEQDVIKTISECISKEVFQYATVLFTHGDQLDEGQTVEEYFHQNQLAKELLENCGGRCHVIDNKYWKNNQQDEYRSNQFQVKELLKTVDQMVEANKGSCYTNQMLQSVEEEIQREEEELIRQSSGNMTRKEARKLAKFNVFNNLKFKLASIASTALLGGLYGMLTMVQDVVKVLKKYQPEPEKSQASVEEPEGAAAEQTASTFVAEVAVKGGVAGYHAADEAPQDVAEKAAEAVTEEGTACP
ncbi:GTPase IMAP family member 7-like isoform X2 [Eleginops maclovinus]|uniref:GTPase IMAP family member 7-like isoform X2 n=1 Tax=Eleginops maclovinus TaxID=56733 RepID=UPI003080A235